MNEEIWMPIKGYEGVYEISSLGRYKTLPREVFNGYVHRHLVEKIKYGTMTEEGYMRAHFIDGTCPLVHRLAAEAFIPNPNNFPEVNHKDENKANNSVANLEWCDRNYNVNYGTRGERISKANSKEVIQYTLSGSFVKKWKSASVAEAELGYKGSGAVTKCCRGQRKSAYGSKWEYSNKGEQ